MNKGQMLGARLPLELVRDLELIEVIEQTDRSSTAADCSPRRSASGSLSITRGSTETGNSRWHGQSTMPAYPCGKQWNTPEPERWPHSTLSKLSDKIREPSPEAPCARNGDHAEGTTTMRNDGNRIR